MLKYTYLQMLQSDEVTKKEMMKLNIICAFIKDFGFAPTIERIRLLEYALNLNWLSLSFEIIGAYGNVSYEMINEEIRRKCEK